MFLPDGEFDRYDDAGGKLALGSGVRLLLFAAFQLGHLKRPGSAGTRLLSSVVTGLENLREVYSLGRLLMFSISAICCSMLATTLSRCAWLTVPMGITAVISLASCRCWVVTS